MSFQNGPSVVMPEYVEDQNRQINQAGIPDLLQTGLGSHADLLHWAAIDVQPYGTSDLLLCAGYRGGEFTTRPLARNCVENSYEGVCPPLSLEQLRLLERLALGPETELRLEYGRRFVYTGITPPGKSLPLTVGEVVVIEAVTFGHVGLRSPWYSVSRSLFVPPAFREIPTY